MPSQERAAHTSHGARRDKDQQAADPAPRYGNTMSNFAPRPLRVMSSIRSNKIKQSNRASLEKASMNIQNVFNHGNRGGVKIKAAALFMNRRSVGRRNNYGTVSLNAAKAAQSFVGVDSAKASRFNTGAKSHHGRNIYDNSGRQTTQAPKRELVSISTHSKQATPF
jgi:hypothetical protein